MKSIESIFSVLSNRMVPLLGCAVLLFMLLRQCGISEDARKEANRHLNNMIAKEDSVRYLDSKLDNVLAEKSAFKLKYEELSDEQEKLVKQLELAGKKKPGVIVKTEVVYRDTTIVVASNNHSDGDSSYVAFTYNPDLPGTNRLYIGGKLPYSFDSDSTIIPGNVSLQIEQKIDLVTGLYSDPKTGMLYVRASSTFPGITFGDIQALDMVDDPETKKALKAARKPFGVGISAGYGVVLNSGGYSPGPYIGFGISYSPKWMQFGK